MTMSIYKKQNLEQMFTEHQFLLSHYQFFLKDEFPGISPYVSFQKIMLPQEPLTLRQMFATLESTIDNYYKHVKYERKYVEVFREYYLYHDKLNPASTKDVYIWTQEFENPDFKPPPNCKASVVGTAMVDQDQNTAPAKTACPAPKYVVTNFNFYETLLEFQIKTGEFKTKNKGEVSKKNRERAIAEVHYKDEKAISNGNIFTSNVSRVTAIVQTFDLIRISLTSMLKAHMNAPVSHYIVLPEDQQVSKSFNAFFIKYHKDISSRNLYNIDNLVTTIATVTKSKGKCNKAETRVVSDFSWYVVEVLYIVYNNINANEYYYELQREFESKYSSLPSEYAKYILMAFANLPATKRKDAIGNILLSLKLDQYNTIAKDVVYFMLKHPVFTHVYLSNAKQGKEKIYSLTIFAYTYFLSKNKDGSDLNLKDKNMGMKMMENLVNNGGPYKDFVNSVQVLHMFLVEYQEVMSELYYQQYRSDIQFFKELWDPFYKDFFLMRINEYYRRMSENSNYNVSFGQRFLPRWQLIGQFIKRLKSQIAKAFTRKPKMPKEKPALQVSSC